MSLSSQEQQGSPNPSPFGEAKALFSVLYWVVRSLALTWELMLRRDFGSRYFSIWTIIPVAACFGVLYYGVIPQYTIGFEAGPLFVVFGEAFMGLVIVRGVMSLRKGYGRIQQHSYYPGTPLSVFYRMGPLMRVLPFSFGDSAIRRLWEPLLAAVVAMTVGVFDPSVGRYLFLCAIGWAIKNNLDYRMAYDRVIGSIDAHHDSQGYRAAGKELQHGASVHSGRTVQARGAAVSGRSVWGRSQAPSTLGLMDDVVAPAPEVVTGGATKREDQALGDGWDDPIGEPANEVRSGKEGDAWEQEIDWPPK